MAAWAGLGLLALRQGDLPKAFPLLERAMGLCQTADLHFAFASVGAALGAAYVLAGRVAEAVPLLTQVMAQVAAWEGISEAPCGLALGEAHLQAGRREEAHPLVVPCGLALGEAHLQAGHREEAHALAERTLALARARQERGHEAYALRLLGAIAAHRDPPDVAPAAAHYRQALALVQALGMRPLQAHCHRGLGVLYGKMGRRERARAELSAALDLYRAMAMTFWLPQVERALAPGEGR
jgi:tetratricopeptide (TPR) repeat protein